MNHPGSVAPVTCCTLAQAVAAPIAGGATLVLLTDQREVVRDSQYVTPPGVSPASTRGSLLGLAIPADWLSALASASPGQVAEVELPGGVRAACRRLGVVGDSGGATWIVGPTEHAAATVSTAAASLHDDSPIILWTSNARRDRVHFNLAWFDYTGRDRGDERVDDWAECVHPEDLAAARRAFDLAIEGRETCAVEYRLRGRDGGYRWMLDVARALFDPGDGFGGFVGAILDIERTKAHELALDSAERRWRFALEGAASGVMDWSPGTDTVSLSPRASALLAMPGAQQACTPSRLLDAIHDDDRALFARILDDYRRGAIVEHECELRLADLGDGQRWVHSRGRVFDAAAEGAAGRVIGVFDDITRHKVQAESLQQSRQHLLMAMEQAALAWYSRDRRTQLVYGSPSLATICDLADAQGPWTIAELQQAIHPEDRALHASELERIAHSDPADAGLPRTFALRILRRDGEVRHVEVRYAHQYDDTHDHSIGIVFDVTHLRRAELAYRALDARLETALEQANMAWFERNVTTGEMNGPPSLQRIYGIPPGQRRLNIADILERLHPDDRLRLAAIREQVLRREIAEDDNHILSYRIRRPDGSEGWIEVRFRVSYAAFDGQGGLFGFAFDITANRRAELERAELAEQLRQAQKMEAVGQLTGGIAHDFNNILSAILGYATLAQSRFGDTLPEACDEYLGEIVAAGERARDMVSNMLAFSRGQSPGTVRIGVGDLVDTTVKMMRPALPSSLLVAVDRGCQEAVITADPVQVQQVLINLLVNARDALEGVGKITIAVDVRDVDGARCSSCRLAFSGRHVAIAVTDSGPGIAPAVLDSIFEPFFTTKPVGRGTGMGLSMSHGIVHQHGGHLCVESAAGRGSTFELLLPAQDPARPPTTVDATHAPAPDAPPWERHVLVVDDEPQVGNYVVALLETSGYSATYCRDGVAALELVVAGGRRFAALVTDQTMPHMTGLQLAERIREVAPTMPVLLMSGYNQVADGARTAAAGIAACIAKPIDVDTLLQALRTAIDGVVAQG